MEIIQDVMLDLETMSTQVDAAIISIGAVSFNADKLDTYFSVFLDLGSSVRCGGHLDPKTIMWWMEQGEEARKSLTHSQNIHIVKALGMFSDFISEVGDPKTIRIWGNGADFDNTVLRSAYVRAGLDVPWSFRTSRCFRTMKNLFPLTEDEIPTSGIKHNALDDAIYQARCLIRICNKYGITLS